VIPGLPDDQLFCLSWHVFCILVLRIGGLEYILNKKINDYFCKSGNPYVAIRPLCHGSVGYYWNGSFLEAVNAVRKTFLVEQKQSERPINAFIVYM
jgi:hypothetical protein